MSSGIRGSTASMSECRCGDAARGGRGRRRRSPPRGRPPSRRGAPARRRSVVAIIWSAEVISRSASPQTARCSCTQASKSARLARRADAHSSAHASRRVYHRDPAVALESARAHDGREPGGRRAELVRGLGAWDGALVTIGSVLGTGIFITTGDMARALPHPGLILLAWAGGRAADPRRRPHLRRARRHVPARGRAVPLPEGGLRARLGLPVRLGGLPGHHDAAASPPWRWASASTWARSCRSSPRSTCCSARSGPGAGPSTADSSRGPRHRRPDRGELPRPARRRGAAERRHRGQDRLARWASRVFGLLAPARRDSATLRARSPVGTGWPPSAWRMIAVLWSYDGWYGVTYLAGEMRRPERDLPLGLIVGTAAVTAALRADEPGLRAGAAGRGDGGDRPHRRGRGRGALRALGRAAHHGGRARLHLRLHLVDHPLRRAHLPADGPGRPVLPGAGPHPSPLPHARRPASSRRALWSVLLTFSGSYEQLYTYVVFAVVLFHAADRGGGLRAAPHAARRPAALSHLGLSGGAGRLRPRLGWRWSPTRCRRSRWSRWSGSPSSPSACPPTLWWRRSARA